MQNQQVIVSIQELSKTFGTFRALEKINLNINAGEIFGILGLNAAGKTTLLRCVVNFLKPDEGTIFFKNNPLTENEIHNYFGYLPEDFHPPLNLSAEELLFFLGSGLDSGLSPKICLERVGLLKEKNIGKIAKFLTDDTKICPVCQLFGSTVVGSKIKITDLPLTTEKAPPSVRHGVAINRDTETAQDKAKFDFEAVPKESRFTFELIGENLNPDDLALLAIGIQEMVEGNFWIGGNSARGLGKCKLDKNTLKIEYFKGAEGLKKYLAEKKPSCSITLDEFSKAITTLTEVQEASNA